MIPEETVNVIRDTVKIEDIVGDYVTLKRRGANLVACCPFHNEKTPSFYVSPVKGIYKCFGCGKSGTAIGFIMEQEHCSYVEALRYIAKRYNIEIIEEENAEEIQNRQKRESLLLVSEFACKFFAQQLKNGEGLSVGYNYFRSRGLEDATIEKFGLGWAPSGRTALIDAAVAAGYKTEYLIEAGLAVQREDGSIVDKFRERAMFPIHSVSGRVVAFSGRTLHADNPAKYVNSPETEIYVKSRNLLGIYFAKAEINRMKKCILVEGNVDMVTMHQLGICNVVASCGTSLTVEQIRLIHKFADDVTIMYDGDSAGIHAALRGINLVLKEGLNVKIVLLPDGEDPDSFCRKHTLEEVQRFIAEGERDFIEFKSDLLLSEAGRDPLKKATLINDIADTIADIPDPVKRSVYVENCSMKFGIESGILFSRIMSDRKKQIEEQNRTPYGEETQSVSQVPVFQEENPVLAVAEREILKFLLTHGTDIMEFESDSDFYSGSEEDKPAVADFIREALEDDETEFCNSAYKATYNAYMQAYDEGLSQDEIIRKLFDSPDRIVAEVASGLSSEKYNITIESFKASMTNISTWLVQQVPKTLIFYSESRIRDQIDKLRKSLPTTDDQEGVMKKIVQLQSAHRKLQVKLGREKK